MGEGAAFWECVGNFLLNISTIVSFITSLASIILTEILNGTIKALPKYKSYLKWMASLLPLGSTFLLSLIAAFSPRIKYGQITLASGKVVREIYEYRSMVKEYVPRSNARDKKLKEFLKNNRN